MYLSLASFVVHDICLVSECKQIKKILDKKKIQLEDSHIHLKLIAYNDEDDK